MLLLRFVVAALVLLGCTPQPNPSEDAMAVDLDVNGGKVVNAADGTSASDLATKGQMDTAVAGAVDAEFSGSNTGYLARTGASAYTVVQAAFGQAGLPTVNDDSSAGYSVGSFWEKTNGDRYVCVDASVGTAKWRKVLQVHRATAAPTSGDDTGDGFAVGDIWERDNGERYTCVDNSAAAAVWQRTARMFADLSYAGASTDLDVDHGFSVGDMWLFDSGGSILVCRDNSSGAAVWTPLWQTEAGTTLTVGRHPRVSATDGDLGNSYLQDTTSGTTPNYAVSKFDQTLNVAKGIEIAAVQTIADTETVDHLVSVVYAPISGDATIYLPLPAYLLDGHIYWIKKVDTGGPWTLTIDADTVGGSTVDGNPTLDVTNNNGSVMLIKQSGAWLILGNY